MPFKNFPTPHCHPRSLDSASTPKEFAKREIELGTGCLTCTDHGTMQACREVYDIAKKEKLTPILGIEAYFRDDNCPILKSFGIDDVKGYLKYYHITLHAMDQAAYEALVRILSRTCINRMEKHGSEAKPLFNWADLEELAKFNITFTSGCLVGMVQRHVCDKGRKDIADAYLAKLKEIVPPGNLYVEVFPHETSKNWVSGVFFTLEDGRTLRFYDGKTLKINGENVKAGEYAEGFKPGTEATLEGVKTYNKWEENFVPGKITNVIEKEEFIENECIPDATDSDSQKWCNLFMWDRANLNELPILISDDSHFAYPNEKEVQDIRLLAGGDSWRFYGSYHRMSSDEAWEHFKKTLDLSQETFEGWIENNITWASRFKEFHLKDRRELPTRFYPENTLLHTKRLIDKHGRMDWQNQAYTDRLKAEIDMLHFNGTVDLLPYFFIDEEVCELYEKNGLLTGPGRGSAAGLLLSYLLGITHVDPLRFQLSMERFLTLDRIKNGKWPDIDQDLPHRNLLIDEVDPSKGWLHDRFGDCFAQIGTDISLKLKSSIKDVARVRGNGKVPKDLEKLVHGMMVPPQGVEDRDFVFGYEGPGGWVEGSIESDTNLQKYIKEYPEDWKVVQNLLGLVRQKGRHACGFVVTNEPVSNFIPLTVVGKHVVTQYTSKPLEASGGLKMDFLVIHVLKDISDAIRLIQERHPTPEVFSEARVINSRKVPPIRLVPLADTVLDIWDLPPDTKVFNQIAEGRTETVFQLNTNSAKQYLRLFNRLREDGSKGINSVESIAAFTALDRPGPLDAYVTDKNGRKHNMLEEYANRAIGKEATNPLPILTELLPETYGVIVYQEQLQKIFYKVGKTTPIEADNFRVHIGKKEMSKVTQDREIFMRGAVESVGQETAEALWNQMFTFGQYGFNKSHAVSYAVIAYACAFLKYHYPLEWWTAVLRNADRNEIDEKFWKYCSKLILLPDIGKSTDNFFIEGDKIRAPLSLLHGVGKAAHDEIVMGRPYANIEDFINRKLERRRKTGKMVTKDGKQVLKLGYSALSRRPVYSLIISGAMDSLFPPEINTPGAKCEYYEQEQERITGKKMPPKDREKFLIPLRNMTSMEVFQRRKVILPAYADSLEVLFCDNRVEGVSWDSDRQKYVYRDKQEYLFVNSEEFARMTRATMLPEGGIVCAIAAYIIDERRFKYQGGAKEACELVMDLEGSRIKAVRWPGRNGALPADWPSDMKGSLAIVILNRWNENKPDFAIEDAKVVLAPLAETPESSPD